MTDSTVIYVLSESFSDPSRVPGLKINKDSMPNIRSIKENTPRLMLLPDMAVVPQTSNTWD